LANLQIYKYKINSFAHSLGFLLNSTLSQKSFSSFN